MKILTRNDDPFELTDKIEERYLRLIVRRFRRLARELNSRRNGRTILAIDAINALDAITACYDDVREICWQAFRAIALKAYRRIDDDEDFPVDMWLDGYMKDYDPVTHYIFDREWDNKRLRLLEAVILAFKGTTETGENATPASLISKAVDKALMYASKQFRQYGDDITLEAIKQAYEDNGVAMVVWVTQKDERVCPECRALDGHQFELDDAPPPQHYNCRCFLVPVRSR